MVWSSHAKVQTAEAKPLCTSVKQTVWSWNLRCMQQPTQSRLFPVHLTHSESPDNVVHPIQPLNTLPPACAEKQRPSTQIEIRHHPYGKLRPSASLSTVSRTFNSLFKVLCIFPSRYLFAIGLVSIFSFGWSIPPTLGCTLKQPDSMKGYRIGWDRQPRTGLSPSVAAFSKAFRSPTTQTLLL